MKIHNQLIYILFLLYRLLNSIQLYFLVLYSNVIPNNFPKEITKHLPFILHNLKVRVLKESLFHVINLKMNVNLYMGNCFQ